MIKLKSWGLVAIAVAAIGMCMTGKQAFSVRADVAQWPSNATVPAPMNATTGLPEFVPFNNVMSANQLNGTLITGSSSQVLTSSSGDVGVQVTKTVSAGTSQSGSIWSLDTLDLTKDFHAKMLLYFGVNDAPGDGLAFAMVGTRPSKAYDSGGSLGVWMSSGQQKALENSFAVVFDSYPNNDRYDRYVTPTGRQFMGWGFPGQTRYQYDKLSAGAGDNAKRTPGVWWAQNSDADGGISRALAGAANQTALSGPGLGGYQVLPAGANYADGVWHPLAVDWIADGAGGGKLTYSLTIGGTVLSKSLTWSAANISSIFGTNKVYWGFTGSTGANTEDGAVAFQNIPGLVDSNATSTITAKDGSALADSVYDGDQLNQRYKLTYNGANSKQSWGNASTTSAAGSLSARFVTGENYAFISDADGKVPVTFTDKSGTKQTLMATPTGTVKSMTANNGDKLTISSQISVASIDGFKQTDGNGQTATLDAPIVATTVGDAQSAAESGVVIGNNAQTATTLTAPAVLANPVTLSVPSNLSFGSLSIAQMIKGVKSAPGQFTNADGSADSTGIVAKFPASQTYSLTASLSSFALGSGYSAGSSQISFDYNGGTVQLKDDGQAAAVFASKSTAPSAAVANVALTTAAYPQISAKKFNAEVDWTLVADPSN